MQLQPENQPQAVNSVLLNRDYTMIIDRSGSMGTVCKNNKTRYESAQEAVEAVAREMAKYDPDGITVYSFSNRFQRYDHTTAAKVHDIFTTNKPTGSTDLAAVLSDAFFGPSGYFTRKQQGKAQPNGELIVVATDGEPDDQAAVAQTIVRATQKMLDPNEINVTFVQIGDDPRATSFLKKLDDDLEKQGAKFDIVDTITIDNIGNKDLTQVLLDAILEHKQH